ncbi:MAG: ABC transporter permease [Synergistales bacterium]
MKSRLKRFFGPLVLPLVVLAAWEIGSRMGVISPMFFPSPATIAKTLADLAASGRLGVDLKATLGRVAIGLSIGVGLGLPLGLLMGWKPGLRYLADPMVAATHALPKIAMYPILMVLFGIGDGSRVALIALGAFFPMLINAMSGVRQIDPRFFEVAESYGARGGRILTEVVWPGSLPFVLAGFRLALNGALLLGIAAELLTAREGLGGMIWMAWQTFRTEEMYAALFVTGLLGVAFNGLTNLLVRKLAPWRPQAGAGN